MFSPEEMRRLQQVPNAFRDDARFPCSRSRNHQQRPFAVRDRAPLRLIQLSPESTGGFRSNSVAMIQEG